MKRSCRNTNHQERFYSKHNHYATNKSTNNPLQCHERKPSSHTAGTGNLASKKFANRQDKCVLVYVFL